MGTPTTTMRIDEDVKNQARPILEDLGLNVSSAVSIFLKAVIRCNGLPFEMTLSGTSSTSQITGIDFAAEYLAPLMSARNESTLAGFDPSKTRERLLKRNGLINRGRRTIV